MRTKVTLILVFLNVALFGFIFKFERTWRTEQASLEARRRVLGPETADIRTLQISGPGVTAVKLVRQGDNWSLTEPIEWPANPHAVRRIVNELQFLEHETSFKVAELAKNHQSLADYGLDHPRLTVTFTAGDATGPKGAAEPISLRIGDETKDGNRLYVLSPDGTRVHVVGLSLARTLGLPVEELRANTVFTIPVFETRSLNLQTAANLRVRVRRDGNRWSFEAPFIARASKTAVELTVNALNALQVQSFVAAGSADHNPANNPSLRITLEGNNRRETLILGNELAAPAGRPSPDAVYYAMLEGKSTLFTVKLPGALLDALRNSQEILRETTVLDFDPALVTAITLAAPNHPELTLQRLETNAQGPAADTASWQIVHRDANQGPQTQPADNDVVQDLLKELSLLSAQKFVSDAPSDADLETWGFNRPEREVSLALANGTTLKLQLGLSSQHQGRAYARVTNARSVYLVDDAILRATPVTALDYRQRLLRVLPDAARIGALKLTDLKDKTVVLDRSLPADHPVSDDALGTLLGQLRRLHARHFVQAGFPASVLTGGEERPWRYRLDATIILPGGPAGQTEVMTLYFTPRTGGAIQLAGSPEFDAVFEVEQPMLDALWQLTYGAKDPGPPPAPPETPHAPAAKP
ncbi:MAG: DUF4340 domain-containing protein [Opitutales bacterium]